MYHYESYMNVIKSTLIMIACDLVAQLLHYVQHG